MSAVVKAPGVEGSVYLLHLDPPYKHARHYVGWSVQVTRRIAHHRAGRGARLLQVVREAGGTFRLGRVWRGRTRRFERALKKREFGALDLLCPICCHCVSARSLPLRQRRR